MNLKYYLNKARDVRIRDFLSVFPMIAGRLACPFFRKRYRHTWAVCERATEARDNGYHFYRYMRTAHPEQPCVYAIDRKCRDYRKVVSLGPVVQFGSIRHWILYFSCPYLISSQQFHPNGYLATLLERTSLFRPRHVFLQHGITKDIAEFLLASHMRATYFIAGARPEYEFMKKEFGYPDGTMQYTGFARFDALHRFDAVENRILIMPTWRKWLRFKSETHSDAQLDIDSSEYLARWKELLHSPRLLDWIDRYHLEVIFYPHPNMRGIMDPAAFVPPQITVADGDQMDLQELLKSAQLLITDYSSVYFDMIYMKKPVIFYQFDEEKYRKYHYQQGWFDYHKTAFGPSCATADQALSRLEELIAQRYQVSRAYLDEHAAVYPLYDDQNCRRIYELLAR